MNTEHTMPLSQGLLLILFVRCVFYNLSLALATRAIEARPGGRFGLCDGC